MKKQLLFKNSTKYSKQLYDKFTLFHNEKNSLNYDLFTIFILILFLYCIFATIQFKIFSLTILFILMFIFFVGYRIFNPIYLYKKETTKKEITDEKIFKFYFYNTYFKVRNNLDFDKISYFRLYRVYETKEYFYLYLTKKYSFIIDKKGFSLGTEKEFSNFMKNKMKFKYCRYQKKLKK